MKKEEKKNEQLNQKNPSKQEVFAKMNSIPIILSILSAVLLIIYGAYPHFYARITIILSFIMFIIPVMANYFVCIMNQNNMNQKNEKLIKEVQRYLKVQKYIEQVDKETQGNQVKLKQNKRDNITSIKEYKHKSVTNDNYSSLKNLIISSCKARNMKRQMILDFKKELDRLLGTNVSHYNKMTFENDLHEIYVKLKSSHLTDEDYIYLKDFLNQMIQEKEV